MILSIRQFEGVQEKGNYEQRTCEYCGKYFYTELKSRAKYCTLSHKSSAYNMRRRKFEAEFENETRSSDNNLNNENMDQNTLEKMLALNNELNEAKTQLLLKNQEIERLEPLAEKYEKEASTLRYRLQSASNLID